MNLTVRKADVSDVKIICALGIATFYEAYFLQDESHDLANYVLENFGIGKIEKEIRNANATFFIAEADGCAFGYAKLRENEPAECVRGENTIEIQRIYILEKMRGKSAGDMLMQRCFAEARRKNYDSVWLGVWEKNLPAQSFYRKLGFVKAGELNFPYGQTVGINYVLKLDLK